MLLRFCTTSVILAIISAKSTDSSSAALATLSPSCSAVLIGFATSTTGFGQCFNAGGFISMLQASYSMVEPMNAWLSQACNTTCSAAALSSAQVAINSSCSNDIATGNTIAKLSLSLVSNYAALQNTICLQSMTTSSFCMTNLVKTLQTATGNSHLSIGSLQHILSLLSHNSAKNVLCTDCNSAFVHALSSFMPDLISSTAPFFANYCTSAFLNEDTQSTVYVVVAGTVPATIVGTVASQVRSSST